ncbi:nucleolar protein 14 homolog [Sitophilus oryzae]|uniref:Nucleolar protein 14 homolog n=1 Tax=Sitophilus oryzae TaxID=7048 RepID=A0A6J2XR80_SITOR|nr:nucleolar protein 14 homolog [Sitophilus oryzae]
MVKVKNHKRVSVEQIQKKRQNQNAKKTLNPFEVHINKEKMRVLGKKAANQRGVPGISRAKAIQKRKHTLLPEFNLQHKSNRFLDKRIGEKSKMSNEEKVAARFAAFKAKSHNRKSIFNLSEEILSHRDHTLSEIEKFENLHSDDEESDNENNTGKLDSDFVEEAHFGNGMLTNTGREGVKTHKQLIEQLIEESKKRKAEQQKVKEATLELTEKLDNEWKDLVQLVSKNTKKAEEKDQEKSKVDDYDKFMRELRFEARGTVSDRLKTEGEIAQEEKEKLEKLEQERINRMKGTIEDNNTKTNHRSADDLDDNFLIESDVEDNTLSYSTSGQANVEIQAEINGKIVGEDPSENTENESNSESDDEEGNEESEDESSSDDSLTDLKEKDDSSDNSESEEDNSKKIETKNNKKKNKIEIENTEYKKIKVDLKDTVTIIDSDEKACPKKNRKEKEKNKRPSDLVSSGNICKKLKSDITSEHVNKDILESETNELEKVGNELPFTFKLPESYENLMETFKDKSHTQQKIILERMIKCNHPSLAQGNKENLGVLFDYLLQYLNDLFSEIENTKDLKENFQLFKSLMPHIYDLAQLNPENTHNSVLEVIKEKHQEYRKKKKRYPGIEVLIFLKLVSLLFSTSDFRHQIVTPCFVFIEQMLKNCSIKTAGDISYGLFLCTLILEYTSLSNRYLPVTINFLSGILHMAIPKTGVKIIKAPPPFKSLCSDLVLTKKKLKFHPKDKIHISSLILQDIEVEFKISALHLSLKLLREFKDVFKSYSSNVEIFDNVEKYINQIPWHLYPDEVKSEHKEFYDSLNQLKSERKLQYLIMEEKKPKALRLYEPKIETVYDGKRHKVQSREKAERDKLHQKLKKETKGAMREIRRDKAFLGRIKLNQRIQSDLERKQKVNRIFAEAATQQSELNTLDRKNKKK